MQAAFFCRMVGLVGRRRSTSSERYGAVRGEMRWWYFHTPTDLPHSVNKRERVVFSCILPPISGRNRKAFDDTCTLNYTLLTYASYPYSPGTPVSSDCTISAQHYRGPMTDLPSGIEIFITFRSLTSPLTMQNGSQKYIGQKLFDWKLVSTVALQNSATRTHPRLAFAFACASLRVLYSVPRTQKKL